MPGELTTNRYWDSTYDSREQLMPVSLDGYRSYCSKRIYEKKELYLSAASSVLELGGGGSRWLAYFAKEFPEKDFCALDYSEFGCSMLESFAKHEKLNNLSVECGDFFCFDFAGKKFDLVYSHGVVEHFEDLAGVLQAHSGYLNTSGVMVTVIPNMAGILGSLTKKLNRKVYDIHIPHDLKSFQEGHYQAGLDIIESGYLCSSNFGVLSSCFQSRQGMAYRTYVQLTRVSKALWWFEDKFFALPKSKWFSPYIFSISKRK
ncbi:class I SAM-dependent methyltransferase [Salinivibrio kushneri]|uniref:class I SAM-dependent methyltransferase n=1 Tax=Salinivibrio kushneri TaxID=1908198 RepID=UPI0022B5BF5B|nr:class I SAM-dependent methyltransferase [Salinivibrio kushneri]WBA17151.1 class I SAM-dependent methyltransferase [Salinivibrio kushneri]